MIRVSGTESIGRAANRAFQDIRALKVKVAANSLKKALGRPSVNERDLREKLKNKLRSGR